MEKFVNFFGIFFAECQSEGCWVGEHFPCCGVFWASSDDLWSIERFSLHALHTGAGSLEMRQEWVRCVWPILARVIMTSSLLFRLGGKFHFLTEGLMFLRLFVSETVVQFFCHVRLIINNLYSFKINSIFYCIVTETI